ncbi:MAG: TetR/AcrR family transcriptional regulator [Proteobacteria bacterium]|nr:TetR/AcrR family transcriptional regulator [Pseudomonadota bacterium]
MPLSSMRKRNTPERAGWTQRRGQLRREALQEAAARLLKRREIDDVSLEDVAREARIPVASAYHFYKDRNALFVALAAQLSERIAAIIARPYSPAQRKDWHTLIKTALRRVTRHYAMDPAARKLLLDGKTPAEIKLAERLRDQSVGALMEGIFARHFALPTFAERTAVFFHTVEIADLLLQLSVMQHRRITPMMERHALIACTAYLQTFLPGNLPPRRPPL